MDKNNQQYMPSEGLSNLPRREQVIIIDLGYPRAAKLILQSL